MAEHDLVDIINCPHVLALANSKRLLGLAEQYLHCKPTLSSLMLRWSFPTDTLIGNVQRFHRDGDDWRYLKVMVYLTDVGALDGPYIYVPGTQDEAGIHKGDMPVAAPRLMLQLQYSLLPSYANRYLPQRYTGAFAFDRYVNRLLVA